MITIEKCETRYCEDVARYWRDDGTGTRMCGRCADEWAEELQDGEYVKDGWDFIGELSD